MITQTGPDTWSATLGREEFTIALEDDNGWGFSILHANGEHCGYGAETLLRSHVLEELAVMFARMVGHA